MLAAVRRGETVFVTGAAGGVGLAAIETGLLALVSATVAMTAPALSLFWFRRIT